MGVCFICGGFGKPGGCPKCHKDSTKIVVPKGKEDKFIKDISFKQVPLDYVGTVWNKDLLLANHPELDKDLRFKDYANMLDKIHNKFMSGLVPSASIFISAKSKMSKCIFAYSCMQYALSKGHSVAPIIDTIELQRLLILSGENPKWKLYNYINYDDYITSEVLFLTVTKTERHSWSFPYIQELLDRRSRLNLPTFVISSFGLKELARDCDADYDSIVDGSAQLNPFKYPLIIEY